MELLRKFENLGIKDVPLAGGKGASLGEMSQSGIPVPPGFVVLAGTFDRFIDEASLNDELDAALNAVNPEDIASVEEASEKIRALIMGSETPADIATEIMSAFKELGAEFVAVRSSATAEDALDASWAGELESYLNTTEDQLLDTVKKCWSSLFTPRAIFYRFEKQLHKHKVSVAVVVQKMIQSDASGIAFTVHPVTQDHSQMVIEAGYGLGEAIVGGMITPDTFVIDKVTFEFIERYISEQSMMIVRKDNGNEEKEVPAEKREQQKIGDEVILEVAKICLVIEKHYGKPQDIEWAHEAGETYIVQSRPITTLT